MKFDKGEDHPHVHGEYNYTIKLPNGAQGSPPRTWGIRPKAAGQIRNAGITPTYMGNTSLVASYHKPRRDHPHVHGEYTKRSLMGRGFYIRKP